ncbi:LacI family DNA-binding transcriptional regulator [Leptothrix discophora]|uniref:LacI family DNA-binding transcriptional regulator n=1 Tax=Leptothrix discophora TaxID=89 RepID=A0ABT9G4Q8_LEPDI|nr:LacI family DNA-binding transcriptional regulator [Leptothrix discophora]MDP4301452.1 LacI family DNA-binding transcriptional regulator [Leptothrix discophora]
MTDTLRTPTTSAEVARQAGVSRTTVSFVLNGVENRGISEATRDRVLAVARELGYAPNAAARQLAGGGSGTIGLVIPQASHLYTDVFLSQMVASVNDACHREGLKLLIESTEGEGREPGGFIGLVQARRIDGLLIVSPRRDVYDHLHRIAEAAIPLVVLGRAPAGLEHIQALPSNNTGAVGELIGHLHRLGHRRIGHVAFAPAELLASHERIGNWREAMDSLGLPSDDAWLTHADISAASGLAATRVLLARQRELPAARRITALFAGNDTIAFGALRALAEAGLRVPEDIAVVGYDDIPLAAYANPPLTTVRTHPIEQGQVAVAQLMSQLRKAPAEAATSEQTEPELVVRASCGTLPGA